MRTRSDGNWIASPGGMPDLGAMVEQSPIATVFVDAQLRYVLVNEEFCRFVGVPREAIIGRRISEGPTTGLDWDMAGRVLTGQVLAGVPLVDWPVEQVINGVRRVYAWSAFRVADHGRILGALGWLVEITGRERATAALEQARARLDLHRRP
jgi:PAS domain S-box-containing protein